MGPLDSSRKRAPRLLLILAIVLALSLSVFAPLASAEETTSYTAAQIHDWLVDAISGSSVSVSAPPSVELTPSSHLMRVTDLSFLVRGITVGLNELHITCDGTTSVDVTGELNVLGKLPRFSCTLDLEYQDSVSKLQVAGISDILIAGTYAPSLSAGDIDTIVDVLNQVLDASALSVTSPGGDLVGIDVVDSSGSKLETEWTGSTSYQDASQVADKLDGMVDTLAQKATDYLLDGEGDWNVTVEVVADASLDLDASFTAFGVTVAVSDMAILFDVLDASVTDALLSIGTATKQVTFSCAATIGCTGYIPSASITSFTVGTEHPGFQDFISDIEAALLDAMSTAIDDIVDDTGLTLPYYSISAVDVVGTNVVLHEAETITVALPLMIGWNLVSIPVAPTNAAVEVVFPDAVVVHTWDAGTLTYSEVVDGTDVIPGRGYWIAMEVDDPDFSFQGAPLAAGQTLGLGQGWNMVGVAATTAVGDLEIAEADTGQLLTDYVYWWDPSGKTYGSPVTELVPGKGYWLASTDVCTLYVVPPAV